MSPNLLVERLVVGPLGVNCYIAADAETRDAVCIDPGFEADRVAEWARGLEVSVKAVLITHCHPDHILASLDVGKAFVAPVAAPNGEQRLWDRAEAFCRAWGFAVRQPPPPDLWLDAGQTLTYGALTMQTIDVRGHSPAALAYLAGEYVFVGDALFRDSVGRTDIADADHDTLIDHIRRNLLSLPASTIVCPGHGPETTVGREAASNPFLR